MGPRQNVEADSGEKPNKPQALQKKGGNPIEKPSSALTKLPQEESADHQKTSI
jgi:hypothetical protein